MRNRAREKFRERDHYIDVSLGIAGDRTEDDSLAADDCLGIVRECLGYATDRIQFQLLAAKEFS